MNTTLTLNWIKRLHAAEYAREWRFRPENVERVAAAERIRNAKRRAANPELCNARSKESKKKARERAKTDPVFRSVLREKARNHDLVLNYGISAAQYDELAQKQQNKCAICRNGCKTGRRLAVDHDHQTNKIRGLLCSACNRGIGCLQDSETILNAAMEYLKSHNRVGD